MQMVATGCPGRIPRPAGLLLFGVIGIVAAGCMQRPQAASTGSRGRFTRMAQTQPTGPETSEVATAEPAPSTQPVSETQPLATAPTVFEPESTRSPLTEEEMRGGPPGTVVPAFEAPRAYPRVSVTGTYMYGQVSGESQIPSGGHNGTTTGHRPRFKEIGIDDANIFDGEGAIALDPNQGIFIGAQIIHLSGSGRLGQNLVSHSVFFPAKTDVSAHEYLSWYRLGYRYAFVVDTAENGVPDVTLTPWVEALLWDYDYALDAPKIGRKATRSFTKPGVQIGGTLTWRPNGGPLSLEASLGSFPQTSSLAQISTETLLARYRFLQQNQIDLTFLLGVAFEQQYFRDNQFLANHITADFGPMLITGLQLSF